jgi:hypothetical protein
MHFFNIQGQCRSEMYAIRWLFTCRVMAHDASRSNAYALIPQEEFGGESR